MSDAEDKVLIEALRRAFDEDTASLDPSIKRKLANARRRAVSQVRSRSLPRLQLQPAIAFVVTMGVFVLLLKPAAWWPAAGSDDAGGVVEFVGEIESNTAISVVGQELTEQELEMVEDLEFYEWLEARGYAG